MAINGYEVTAVTKDPNIAPVCQFKVKKGGTYGWDFYINRYPTQNCQLTSIGLMSQLLTNLQSNKNDVNAILKEGYRLMTYDHRLLVVDVKSIYIEGVEACLDVVHKHQYTSTNNSLMCLFLAKLR